MTRMGPSLADLGLGGAASIPAMASHLQELAEALADRLGRSVAVDDARVRLLAHSPHRGAVDPARAESVLRRAVSQDIVDHVFACRDPATGLYLVTPRPDLGLEDGRMGQPILHQGSLLGFVWLLASEGELDPRTREAIERSAAEAAAIIHRDHLHARSMREREDDLVARLIAGDQAASARAAAELREERLFDAGSYSAIAVDIARAGGTTEADRLALTSALAALRSRRLPHELLTLERRDGAVLLVADAIGASAADDVAALAVAARGVVLAGSEGVECWVGTGRSRDDLTAAAGSIDEASRAARIARRIPALGPVAAVSSLGVYEMLDQVPPEALRAMMHPGLAALIDQGADPLIRTLEAFLDNAGDVKTASEQLFAHRTSLYYRLRRIQDLTGLDLSDGDDRLIAHLGLRIARLIGSVDDGG